VQFNHLTSVIRHEGYMTTDEHYTNALVKTSPKWVKFKINIFYQNLSKHEKPDSSEIVQSQQVCADTL